ncbi:MAG: hypothetical protein Fues2KO_31020 [Fuerstiella sp.]
MLSLDIGMPTGPSARREDSTFTIDMRTQITGTIARTSDGMDTATPVSAARFTARIPEPPAALLSVCDLIQAVRSVRLVTR